MLGSQLAAPIAYADHGKHNDHSTITPIKHLIVLIGENRTFDHVFSTYQPKHGESIGNLLSRGIINSDGSPGPNASAATQNLANTPLPAAYFINSTTKPLTPHCRLPNSTALPTPSYR
jgi:phospholipase C